MLSDHIYQRRAVLDFARGFFDPGPKLAPDPVAAPEPNGVEKSEFVAGVVLNNGVVLPNREGVDAGPGTDVAEPKSEV